MSDESNGMIKVDPGGAFLDEFRNNKQLNEQAEKEMSSEPDSIAKRRKELWFRRRAVEMLAEQYRNPPKGMDKEKRQALYLTAMMVSQTASILGLELIADSLSFREEVDLTDDEDKVVERGHDQISVAEMLNMLNLQMADGITQGKKIVFMSHKDMKMRHGDKIFEIRDKNEQLLAADCMNMDAEEAEKVSQHELRRVSAKRGVGASEGVRVPTMKEFFEEGVDDGDGPE